MAKKKKIIEEQKTEPVKKCDQLVKIDANGNKQLAVANCDRKNINIESLIRTIRGQKVMVDFDLAMLYGVQNKRLNEQVKRNKKRFPDDFMFQLTKEEWNILKSQIATAKTPEDEAVALLRSQIATTKDLSKIRTQPFAFTREGIGMLSSVLGSDTAIEMNIRIMRVFTAAHKIMESNAILFQKVLHLEHHQQETDEKIEHILNKMEDNSPKQLPEQIFQTGCVWDAWAFVSDLVRSAKKKFVFDFEHDGADDIGLSIQRAVDSAHKKINLYHYDIVVMPQNRTQVNQYMLRYIYRFNQPRLCNVEDILSKPMDEELSSLIRQQNVLVIDDVTTSGSTLNEVLRTLRILNEDNEITIFSLIGRNDLMAESM